MNNGNRQQTTLRQQDIGRNTIFKINGRILKFSGNPLTSHNAQKLCVGHTCRMGSSSN